MSRRSIPCCIAWKAAGFSRDAGSRNPRSGGDATTASRRTVGKCSGCSAARGPRSSRPCAGSRRPSMPDWSREIRERLSGLKVDPAREQSIVEEISQHLDDRYAELLARGDSSESARRAALAELAGPAFAAALADAVPRPAPSALPPAEGGGFLGGLLRLEPLFTIVAILSLGLGVGANTAIFQLLDAVRLRTLPVQRPDELYNVRIKPGVSRSGNFSGNWPQLTYAMWDRIRSEQKAF